MAVDKLVDSTQLDTDLTSVANAIRAKSGGSGQLAFPAGFVSEIGNIPSGGGATLYYTKYGHAYTKDMEIPLANSAFASAYDSAENLETVRVYSDDAYSNSITNSFAYCTSLKSAVIEPFSNYGHYWFRDCTSLESAQLGKVGVAVTAMTTYVFRGCTQSGLTITIYVADNASLPLANSPFGATNATIIYRSATTGEVKTV